MEKCFLLYERCYYLMKPLEIIVLISVQVPAMFIDFYSFFVELERFGWMKITFALRCLVQPADDRPLIWLPSNGMWLSYGPLLHCWMTQYKLKEIM